VQFAERIRSAALSVLNDRQSETPGKPPAPEPCQRCYKLYGL
jgi:hypothetical protein